MLGRSVGLNESEMAEISSWEGSDIFDDKDRLVLRYTDALSRENRVDDNLYQELATHFSETEIMKLCITVSFAGLVNRVHATFLTDVDQSTLDTVADAPYCLIHAR